MTLSILIPASNEVGHIGPCLSALLASDPVPECGIEIIVIANGCRDDTAARARRFQPEAEARGWQLQVIEQAKGSKIAALNTGDDAARGTMRAYLDADVTVSPALLPELARALQVPAPRYVTGTPAIAPATSRATRLYARLWQQVPFMRDAAPGFGLYAVNAAGRARWGAFPDIISDDTFVRLHFTPSERVQLGASYQWPMVEGFANLVRVRRRQDRGVAQIAEHYPQLVVNDAKPPAPLLPLLRADPLGFAVYASVALAVRLGRPRNANAWVRGR